MTAPAPYFDLANTRGWLGAVSQITGVPNGIGVRDAGSFAAPGAQGRIDWIPVSLNGVRKDVNFVQADTEACGGLAAVFDVAIVASDYGELIKLRELFEAAVDVTFGPPQGGPGAGGGYEIGDSTLPVRGGVTGAETWSTTVRTTLREPTARRYFPPSPVDIAANIAVYAADASGQDQALPNLNGG